MSDYQQKPIFIKSYTPNMTVEEIQKLDQKRSQGDDDPLDTHPVSDNPKPKKPWVARTPVNKSIYILEKACKACSKGCPDHGDRCPPDCNWHKGCEKSLKPGFSKSSVMPDRPLSKRHEKGWGKGRNEFLNQWVDTVDEEGMNYEGTSGMNKSIEKLNNLTDSLKKAGSVGGQAGALDIGAHSSKEQLNSDTDHMDVGGSNKGFMDEGEEDELSKMGIGGPPTPSPATSPKAPSPPTPSVSKALNSRSLSIPPPRTPYDPFGINRSATTPVTRRYSGITQENDVAPLIGETMEEAAIKEQRLLDQASKSCPVHGITFKSNSYCHPCEVEKSQTCSGCGNRLYKSLQGYICTHCNRY